MPLFEENRSRTGRGRMDCFFSRFSEEDAPVVIEFTSKIDSLLCMSGGFFKRPIGTVADMIAKMIIIHFPATGGKRF